MDSKEMSRLALLGMTSGLLAVSQLGFGKVLEEPSLDIEHLIAKPACKGKGGCAGLTAYRAVAANAKDHDADQADDADDGDDDEDDDDQKDDLKKPSTPVPSVPNGAKDKTKSL